MTELFVSAFGISVLVGVATQLTHARHRGSVSSFSLGVMLLFVIITGISGFDAPKFNIDELLPEGGGEGEYYYVARDAVCSGIVSAVAGEFGFSEGDVSASLINFDFESMKCDTVVVTLSGAAALGDYKRVESYVEKIGIGGCRVDVQIG